MKAEHRPFSISGAEVWLGEKGDASPDPSRLDVLGFVLPIGKQEKFVVTNGNKRHPLLGEVKRRYYQLQEPPQEKERQEPEDHAEHAGESEATYEPPGDWHGVSLHRGAHEDSWQSFENQQTWQVDPVGDAEGLEPDLCVRCRRPNDTSDLLCSECAGGNRAVPRVNQPLRTIQAAEEGDFWVYLNGHVSFAKNAWEAAGALARKLKLSPDSTTYIENMIARSALPEQEQMAVGSLARGAPQIWMSNCDRNAVWDAVAEALAPAQGYVRPAR